MQRTARALRKRRKVEVLAHPFAVLRPLEKERGAVDLPHERLLPKLRGVPRERLHEVTVKRDAPEAHAVDDANKKARRVRRVERLRRTTHLAKGHRVPVAIHVRQGDAPSHRAAREDDVAKHTVLHKHVVVDRQPHVVRRAKEVTRGDTARPRNVRRAVDVEGVLTDAAKLTKRTKPTGVRTSKASVCFSRTMSESLEPESEQSTKAADPPRR